MFCARDCAGDNGTAQDVERRAAGPACPVADCDSVVDREAERIEPRALWRGQGGVEARHDLEERGLFRGELRERRAERVNDAREDERIAAGAGPVAAEVPVRFSQDLGHQCRTVVGVLQKMGELGRGEPAFIAEHAPQRPRDDSGADLPTAMPEGVVVGLGGDLIEAVSVCGQPFVALFLRRRERVGHPEPLPKGSGVRLGGEEPRVPDGPLRFGDVAPDVLFLCADRGQPLGQRPAEEERVLWPRLLEPVVDAVAAHEPDPVTAPGSPFEDVEAKAARERQVLVDINPGQRVGAAERQPCPEAGTFEPRIGSHEARGFGEVGVDADDGFERGDAFIAADEVQAACDELAGRAEMQEAARAQHLDPEGCGVEGLEDAAEQRGVPFRAAVARGRDVLGGAGAGAHRAADFAVEIESEGGDGIAHFAGPGELAVARRHAECLEQGDGGVRVEAQHADIEHGLTIAVDGALLGLLGGRRFLEEQTYVRAFGAVDAVVARLFGRGPATEAGHAGPVEPHFGRIEQEQNVAGGYDDLAGAGPGAGQCQIGRNLAVEERQVDRTVAFAGHGHEDFAARGVSGEPSGIAAGMNDQDSQPFEGGRPGLVVGGVGQFALQDFPEAEDGASAAANALAAGVRDDEHIADTRQQPQLLPHIEMRFIRRGLGVVGGGDDQVVPRRDEQSPVCPCSFQRASPFAAIPGRRINARPAILQQ